MIIKMMKTTMLSRTIGFQGGCAILLFVLILACDFLSAQQASSSSPCPDCQAWNTPQAPFRIYGNTYYVGPQGLSSIWITSDSGRVLIDGALPESVTQLACAFRSCRRNCGTAASNQCSGCSERMERGGHDEDGCWPRRSAIWSLTTDCVGRARTNAGRWRDVPGGTDRYYSSPNAWTYSGWHKLDVEVMRGQPLSGHSLCRQSHAGFS